MTLGEFKEKYVGQLKCPPVEFVNDLDRLLSAEVARRTQKPPRIVAPALPCAMCGYPFYPSNRGQKCCSISCGKRKQQAERLTKMIDSL